MMMSDESLAAAEAGIKLKIQDLSLRYELHGSSLRLIEELTRDSALLGDEAARKHFFEAAVNLSPVNTRFFQTFLEDRDFLASSAAESRGTLFDLYYKAACITASPELWGSLIEFALMPDVDFSLDQITGGFNGPPVLFPAPDLFLGVLDFPLAIGLATSQKQRWTGCSAEIEATGSGIEALCAGLDVSPLEQLLVAGLSVAGHHPTASSHLWNLARLSSQKSLRDSMEKWQGATTTLRHQGDESVADSLPPTESTSSSFMEATGLPQQHPVTRRRRSSRGRFSTTLSVNGPAEGGADSQPLLKEHPTEEMKELMWMIFCDSWKLRLVYYRQLSTASLNLSEILDEYRLFEADVPDCFRITEVPLGAALSRPREFKNSVIDAVVRRCTSVTDHQDAQLRKHRCIGLAQKLVSASEKQWKKRKRYETAVSSSGLKGDDLSDEGDDRIDMGLLGNSNNGRQRRGSDGGRALLASTLAMDEDVDEMMADDDERTVLWEGREARQAGTGSALWTKYIQFEEAVLDRLSDRLDQTTATGDLAGTVDNTTLPMRTPSTTGGVIGPVPSSPPSTYLPHAMPSPTSTTADSDEDVLCAIERILCNTRNKVIMQKRQVAATYIRAVDALGDVRLDIFEGFWDFVNRAAIDNMFVPSSKWLSFWLYWIADSGARHQPLKSCCWTRLFSLIKELASTDCENLKAFVDVFAAANTGAFYKCLMAPPWWRVSEVLPPPVEMGGPRDLNIPSVDVLQSHTSELLHSTTKALKVIEETSRDLQSQDNMFFRGDASVSATVSNHTAKENGSNEELYECVMSILDMTEQRVLEMANYINNGDGVGDPTSLYQAFFITLLMSKALRGVYTARLQRPMAELFDLYQNIDEIVSAFDGEHIVADPITITATIWNLKLGLALIYCVCSDLRYFSNLKGSWISTCLIRGELDPRVIAKTLLNQPMDQSFQLVLQRLAEDDHFQILKTRPALLEKLCCLSELATIATGQVCGKHPVYILFEWLSRLAESLQSDSEWSLPEEVPDAIELLPPYPLPPPSVFPKFGAPVRVALDELKARPFHQSNTKRHAGSARNGTEISADLASISSSSSSSDAGSLVQAAAELLKQQRLPQPAPTTPQLQPSRSPQISPVGSDRHSSPITSPIRRLSVEDVEHLTRATRDGHEASLPALAPPIPPLSDHLPLRPNDFPPARSPVLLTGGPLSSASLSHSGSDHNHRSVSPSLQPQVARRPVVQLNSAQRSLLSTPTSTPSIAEKPAPAEPVANAQEKSGGDAVVPQAGSHFLQKRIQQHELSLTPGLLGTGHVEWNTLWVSNIEATVTEKALEHEINAVGCENLKEIRLVRDRFKRSKGFAYVEFESPEAARKAESLLNGRSINGIAIKALISVPKTPLYEEKTLFISNVPRNVDQERLKSWLNHIGENLCAENRHNSSRKRCTEAEVEPRKRCRLESPLENSTTAECEKEPIELQKEIRSDVPWQVVEIRMRDIVDKTMHTYGYVDLSSKTGVTDLLQLQENDPKQLFLEGHQIVLAPSVPKRNATTIRAPKSLQQQKGPAKKGTVPPDPKVLARTLFLTHLPGFFTEKKLRKLCERYGTLAKVAFPTDVDADNRTRGYAFVEFQNAMDAAMAVSALNGQTIGKKALVVQQSNRVIGDGVPEETSLKQAAATESTKKRLKLSKGLLDTGSTLRLRNEPARDEGMTNEDFRRKFLGI